MKFRYMNFEQGMLYVCEQTILMHTRATTVRSIEVVKV